MPPVECAPWCTDGDGHTDATHPEDQMCFSHNGRRVALLRHDPSWFQGRGELSSATTYLARERFEAEPRVMVAVNDDPVLTMTPAEARALYQDLGEALAQAEG